MTANRSARSQTARSQTGHSLDVIDLSQWRLEPLPDENSDEDWDDDRELLDPDGVRVEMVHPEPGGLTRTSSQIGRTFSMAASTVLT